MKIGDFVRTKDGTIGKIIAIDLAKSRQEQYPNHPSKSYWRDKILISCYKGWRTLQNVKKISHNIIDLIEIGDIITTNNLCGEITKIDGDKIYTTCYDGEYCSVEDIKSIVTKEQFKSMEYKVGEDYVDIDENLNEEIEIIEDTPKEDKKIEKLKLYAPYPECTDDRFEDIEEKINEIIDIINKGE